MPKKHVPSYAHTKPSYVHPSLQSARSGTSHSSSTPAQPQSVNQRIQQLRREQAPRATSERRDEVIEVVTSRTVPPDLRRILRMAEVDAPRPKPGTRLRTPRAAGGPRPPPGPAAPTSWLSASRHAPSHVRNLKRKYIGIDGGPSRVCALARATDEEFKRFPSSRSLVHHCLRTFALHWEELAEYEQHYIPALSTQLKEVLLTYLSLYGAGECMDFTSFKTLFQSDEGSGISASDQVRFLDFTGLLSSRFNLVDLGKCLPRLVHGASMTDGIAQLSLNSPEKISKDKAPVEVADSWEDELEDSSSTPTVLPATLTIPIFPNLVRLSLAHPGSHASWTDLLALAPKLNTLTHLSLAYWPRPSTTPNAATTSMVSNHTSVSLGGSDFYSDLDDDWHEAANILRRLSLHTYCLQWLDLEGCTWHKALTWDTQIPAVTPQTATPPSNRRSRRPLSPENWTHPTTSPGPDFNGAWRQITYLNLFQGWIPSDNKSLQNMPAGIVPVQLMRWLRENSDKEDVEWKLDAGETGHAVAEWVEREKVARGVRMKIQGMRKWAEGSWCVVDHGWGD